MLRKCLAWQRNAKPRARCLPECSSDPCTLSGVKVGVRHLRCMPELPRDRSGPDHPEITKRRERRRKRSTKNTSAHFLSLSWDSPLAVRPAKLWRMVNANNARTKQKLRNLAPFCASSKTPRMFPLGEPHSATTKDTNNHYHRPPAPPTSMPSRCAGCAACTCAVAMPNGHQTSARSAPLHARLCHKRCLRVQAQVARNARTLAKCARSQG